MRIRSCVTTPQWLLVGGLLAMGCSGGGTEDTEPVDSVQQSADANCKKSEPKDILIAELMQDSWIAGYPLTRLSVDQAGRITGPALPDLLVGHLEIINGVEEARASVAAALAKISGLPDYNVLAVGPDIEACDSVPAWTPSGITTVATKANAITVAPENAESWRTTHKEFGKQCPLIKTVGNRDVVDPPGDGSTNDPPSQTVSEVGTRANPYGLCPSAASYGSYCKLSYAEGINYTGRACQYYYGYKRCLLY